MATKREIEENLSDHLLRLRCRSIEDYLDWCMKNGLRATIRKPKHELQREVVYYERKQEQGALKAARAFARHPEAIIEQLASGKLPENASHRPYLSHLFGRFTSLRDQRQIKDAFRRLLLVTHDVKGFQGCDAVIARYETRACFADGLLALAKRFRQWKRQPEEWTPQGANPRRLFRDLAAHLFGSYPVPEFLDSAWFAGGDTRVCRRQDWYIEVGNGVSLRSLNLPFTLTKRMAHIALTAVPSACTVEEGWRWAQVVGMGGSERLAQAVIATPLGEEFRDEPFWETVIRLLIDNPLLHPSQVGPLIDYLRYERYSPRRAGETDRLPPDFTMKGRTIPALIARMERWHRQLTTATKVAREQWEPCGIGAFTVTEEAGPQKVRWTIREITTARGLIAEGRAMSHCVSTYSGQCARGAVSVWSLQADDLRVMTIAVNRNRAITEARGKRNALPARDKADVLSRFARLSPEETRLLNRGWSIVLKWALAERLSLPAGMAEL